MEPNGWLKNDMPSEKTSDKSLYIGCFHLYDLLELVKL